MMKGICLGEKANQKSSREPAISRAGASPFASFKPENEKPSAQDLKRAARFSHHSKLKSINLNIQHEIHLSDGQRSK